MRLLHNLINHLQKFTISKPNPKMQYMNMIYQMKKKKVNTYWIVDLNACNAFSSQKISPYFVDLYVGIAKFGKCCDIVL
jgi:hypothetical protein